MTSAPIFKEIETRRKVADIFRNVLKPYHLDQHVIEQELQVHDKYIVENTSQQSGLSRAVLDQMFPHEPSPATLYHYTSIEGLKGISSSGELRLYSIRNRLGQGGELEAFAQSHNLARLIHDASGFVYG